MQATRNLKHHPVLAPKFLLKRNGVPEMTCAASKVLYVKNSNNGKTLEAKQPFCSVVILAIVKFSLYRIRGKIHLHGNDILKHTCEAEQYVSLCRPSYPRYTHRIWGEEGVERAELCNLTGPDLNPGSTRIK